MHVVQKLMCNQYQQSSVSSIQAVHPSVKPESQVKLLQLREIPNVVFYVSPLRTFYVAILFFSALETPIHVAIVWGGGVLKTKTTGWVFEPSQNS